MNPDLKMETLKTWPQHISYTEKWKNIKYHKVPITFGSLILAFSFLYAALAPNIFEQGWDALMNLVTSHL